MAAASLETALDNYREDLLTKDENGQTAESTGPIVLGERLESSQSPRCWNTITYGKGSWILHMLRGLTGDERFGADAGRVAAAVRRENDLDRAVPPSRGRISAAGRRPIRSSRTFSSSGFTALGFPS